MRLVRNAEVLFLAGLAAWLWGSLPWPSSFELLALLILIPFNATMLEYSGLYESHRIEGLRELVRNLLSAQVATFVICCLLLPLGFHKHLRQVAAYLVVGFALIFFERVFVYAALCFLRSRGFDVRRVCVIGTHEQAAKMDAQFVKTPSWGLKVFFWGESKNAGTLPIHRYQSGDPVVEELSELLMQEVVDEVLIFCRPVEIDSHRGRLGLCKDHGVTARLVLVADPSSSESPGPQYEGFLGSATLAVHGATIASPALAFKRLFDICISSVGILATLPFGLVIAFLVKLSSRGPVIFKQRRVGRGGRRFTMYKFRSMVEDAEGLLPRVAARNIVEGPAFKTRNDWRVTTVGQVLRRYSLDELPQLFNVLKGDMSLVGPRPLPISEARGVSQAHRRRFTMRPGLTCLWQVQGRSDIPFASWMRMDLEYVDRWSLWLDTKLLILTIPAVLTGRGAY
jgi:exopolysaccharide biosynthesis polyprenyl glycosylphosphotransferase